jgi:TIR domain
MRIHLIGERQSQACMPSVFLSHNSADKPFVRQLAERLTKSGATVWLDEAQLRIGDSLVDKISEAIQTVDFVAAVISKNSARSPWVKKELSLALTKEIKTKAVVVLPIVIDDCELPVSLADKLYADFRDPEQFDKSSDDLLESMGLRVGRNNYRLGVAIEWTESGPRLFGHGVVISPSEGNALLDRWSEWLPKFIEQEKQRGGPPEEVGPAAHILAVIRACAETYNRVPDEEEMASGTSELARKFDLLYLFFKLMYEEAISGTK